MGRKKFDFFNGIESGALSFLALLVLVWAAFLIIRTVLWTAASIFAFGVSFNWLTTPSKKRSMKTVVLPVVNLGLAAAQSCKELSFARGKLAFETISETLRS